MAVQAQYPPSNVLLLNRNMQEVNDFCLQPQPAVDPGDGGIFLVQSTPNIFFAHVGGSGSGGSGNQRRIGREMLGAAAVDFNSCTNNYNPATNSLPPQTTRLIDLAQLCNRHPSNVVSTGLRLSFGEQQQRQLHQHQQQRQQLRRHQQRGHPYASTSPSFLVSILSEDFAAEIKQQGEEIDRFLQAQGEHLRCQLAEKQQRHYRALMCLAESSVMRRLREKEAEAEKAVRRRAELEARAVQLACEAQQWQTKVRAQEAIAASLQAQLQQEKATASRCCDRGKDEAAVDGSTEEVEDKESAYVDPERVDIVGPSCRACRRRAATVVVLPCRHLCACPECDRLAQACPLCFSPRVSSVEVFLS